MDKVREFRQRARECRIAAAHASSQDLTGHYERLAGVWDKLADERLAFFIEPNEKLTEAAASSPRKRHSPLSPAAPRKD